MKMMKALEQDPLPVLNLQYPEQRPSDETRSCPEESRRRWVRVGTVHQQHTQGLPLLWRTNSGVMKQPMTRRNTWSHPEKNSRHPRLRSVKANLRLHLPRASSRTVPATFPLRARTTRAPTMPTNSQMLEQGMRVETRLYHLHLHLPDLSSRTGTCLRKEMRIVRETRDFCKSRTAVVRT
jgi:hypothetical protein